MHNTVERMLNEMKANREYGVSRTDAEKAFEDIANRFLNNGELSSLELDYFYTFLGKFYPENIGGRLYPYPRYDEKLKPIYEQLANYFTKNLSKNNSKSVIFLQYYYLTQMSKEYGMTPIIRVGDVKYFEEHPTAGAYHSNEFISGLNKNVPYIVYNPMMIKKAAMNNTYIPNLIIAGFHELEHEVQEQNISSETLNNAQALIWAKEQLTRDILGDDFYYSNYKNIFHERDARLVSKKRFYDICKRLGVIESYEKMGIRLGSNIIDEYKLDITQKESKEAEDAIAVDLLDIIASKAISKDPSLLEKYPVLKNIYNKDGSKKTLTEIQKDLHDKCLKDIEEDPSKEEELWDKYNTLIPRICETDNDLQFQLLCQTAANYYYLKDEKKFEETVSSIKELLTKRELSYDEYTAKLQKRISELKNMINKILNSYKDGVKFDHLEYIKYSRELESTEYLLKAILEYNPEFKKKHNETVMKRNIIMELSRKLKHSVVDENKGYLTDKGYIILEPKTKQEIFEDYRRTVSELLNIASTSEEFESDVSKLGIIYSDYIDLSNLGQYREEKGAKK